MHVRREPVGRPQPVHDVLRRRAPQPPVQALRLEIRLLGKKPLLITVSLDGARPVVAQADVHLGSQGKKLAHLKLTHVVERLDVAGGEGQALMVVAAVVVARPDATQASDAQGTEADHVRGAEVVYARSNPATIVELPEVSCRLVVSPGE